MKYYRHKDFGRFAVTVPMSHWVEDGNGGGHRVPDSPQSRSVRILIDIESIVNQLGVRAARSKSGRAKYLAGAIIVDAREDRATDEGPNNLKKAFRL